MSTVKQTVTLYYECVSYSDEKSKLRIKEAAVCTTRSFKDLGPIQYYQQRMSSLQTTVGITLIQGFNFNPWIKVNQNDLDLRSNTFCY